MTTYTPHCLMAWSSACAVMDDTSTSRTVEEVMAELNGAIVILAEIEALPNKCELSQMRARAAAHVAERAIREAQAIQDTRADVARAKGAA